MEDCSCWEGVKIGSIGALHSSMVSWLLVL